MRVINVSLLGHKDHGKSTLIGSLLMNTGAATKVRMKEAEIYSKKLNKPFEPAFILDSFSEEREQGMTYDTTRAEIKFNDLAFALIDVPGHEELIKNMISGASYGDIALLLVSAKSDEGIRDQTKRHLFISRMLGIDKLVVAVNKMDTRDYDEQVFEDIKKNLMTFIEKIGFNKNNVYFVPISAYNSENLVKKSDKLSWYKGKPLIEILHEYANKEGRRQEGALRIITQGVIPGDRGELVVGRIINGTLNVGDKVSILPNNENATVNEITVQGRKVKNAKTGENVALKLDKKIDSELRGTVISSVDDKPMLTDSINTEIFVTNKIGKDLSIKFNGVDIKCNGIKIIDDINTTTGEKSNTKTAKLLEAIDAKLEISKKIPVEDYEKTRELGRFVLYSSGKFAGIGIVTK